MSRGGGVLACADPLFLPLHDAFEFAVLVDELGISDKIRGFAKNVAGFQPLGMKICKTPGLCVGEHVDDECCRDDVCGLQLEKNWGHNEVNFVDLLDHKLQIIIPEFRPNFIIDTSRNGKPDGRQDCQAWCNPRGFAASGYA
mmetsp:Transcript_30352/g.64607  ORF Transcript_30352/g.64607 Transcript_30352/m.64607 type:complete len:142 (+) Transcript_30352:1-426(+)